MNLKKIGAGPRMGKYEINDPLVREAYDLMCESGYTVSSICDVAGIGRGTVQSWFNQQASPNMFGFRAVLEVFGYELKIVPITKAEK